MEVEEENRLNVGDRMYELVDGNENEVGIENEPDDKFDIELRAEWTPGTECDVAGLGSRPKSEAEDDENMIAVDNI